MPNSGGPSGEPRTLGGEVLPSGWKCCRRGGLGGVARPPIRMKVLPAGRFVCLRRPSSRTEDAVAVGDHGPSRGDRRTRNVKRVDRRLFAESSVARRQLTLTVLFGVLAALLVVAQATLL